MDKSQIFGHSIAALTIILWGATFVSSKILLEVFDPVQILLLRFTLGLAVLCCVRPKFLKLQKRRHEFLFIGAAATGTIFYFWLENTALLYTTASNCSIVVSVAPLFIAMVQTIIGREKSLGPWFLVGFVVAMTGIALITFHDMTEVEFGSIGDFLALAAAASWGVYSAFVNRISDLKYDTIHATKRIFAWGVLMMIPLTAFTAGLPDPTHLLQAKYGGNILFLGAVASAFCFVLWGKATELIGATKTGIYIYIQPVTTLIPATLILGEQLNVYVISGIILTLLGLVLSNRQKS